jgi:uncharacterized protein (DUF2267 family)
MTTRVEQVFGSTLQTSELWLKETMEALRTDDAALAYRALRTVLHAIRDHLPPAEVLDLSAQLPMLLRGMFLEGWQPSRPPRKFHRAELLQAVHENVQGNGVLARGEEIVRAVFRVLGQRVSAGEIADMRATLPHEFAAYWPRRQASS